MVKIADYEIVLWETDDFDYVEILKHIKKHPDIKNMCFLFHHNGKITGAVSAEDFVLKRDVMLKAFEISLDLFEKARDFYYNNVNLQHILIPVTDSEGNYIFMLQFIKNIGLEEDGLGKNKYDSYDLIRDKEKLDYTFLERFETYVFTELEEFSFAITKLLLEVYPKKKIIYTDERIGCFYDTSRIETESGGGKSNLSGSSVYILDSVNFIDTAADILKAVIIEPDIKRIYESDISCRNYGSISVLDSLIWCKEITKYGKLNEDKTILLIDYCSGANGIGDIVKIAYIYYLVAKSRGWYIAVNLNKFPNQYLQSEKENVWEYYFEPLDVVEVKEAYKSKNVIAASQNNIVMYNYANIYFREGMFKVLDIFRNICGCANRMSKAVKFNRLTIERIKKKCPNEFLNKNIRILGVIARGTDLKKENAKKRGKNVENADIEYIVKRAKYLKEIYMCDYIFAATEDSAYLERLKEEFEDILYIKQERFNVDSDKSGELLGDKIARQTNPKELGYDYLTAVSCLSECNVLTSSADCGAYHLAQYFKGQEGYDFAEIMKRC